MDALIMDVNHMALKTRKKANMGPIHSPTRLKQPNQNSSMNKKSQSKTLMPLKERRNSSMIDSFLFSIVPNKL